MSVFIFIFLYFSFGSSQRRYNAAASSQWDTQHLSNNEQMNSLAAREMEHPDKHETRILTLFASALPYYKKSLGGAASIQAEAAEVLEDDRDSRYRPYKMCYVSLLNHVYGAVAPRPLPLKLTSCYVARSSDVRVRALCVLMTMRVYGTRADFNLHKPQRSNSTVSLLAPKRPPSFALSSRKTFVRLENLKLEYRNAVI